MWIERLLLEQIEALASETAEKEPRGLCAPYFVFSSPHHHLRVRAEYCRRLASDQTTAMTSDQPISLSADERHSLAFRLVTPDDFDQLHQYRVRCGWGEARLKKHWQDPDRPLCIFSITVGGRPRDIGMGGWILEMPGDRDIACRETQTVEISESALDQH
jgi:hypothetical protein